MQRRSATRNIAITFNSSGDNTIVPSPANGPINVYGIAFTVTGATNITFKDGASTSLSGPFVLTGNGSSLNFSINDEPWYFTQPGNNFVMNSSNAVQVSGTCWYTTG